MMDKSGGNNNICANKGTAHEGESIPAPFNGKQEIACIADSTLCPDSAGGGHVPPEWNGILPGGPIGGCRL
jgi:hypothetical protein